MTTAAQIIFWLSAAWVVYPYAGYPLLLLLVSLWSTRHFSLGKAEFTPTVAVLIAARNEARHIRRKIEETLAWEYPSEKLQVLVASDASEDGTDEVLQQISDARLTYVRLPQRIGKNAALNRLAECASADLLVFCDANSYINTNALRSLVRHFADPRVGCVTGTEQTIRDRGALATGNEAFLDYAGFVNRLESSIGSVLTCDGSLFCIRRELFVPLQPDLANDLELPMQIAANGFAVVYEPGAQAFEESTQSVREEFSRRYRVSGQGVLATWRLRRCLRGLRFWQFLSRKVLRWFTLLPMLALLISSAILWRHPFFAAALLAQAAFYVLALLGGICGMAGYRGGKILDLPFFFVMSNAGALVGAMKAMTGQRFAVWQPITRAPQLVPPEAKR